MFKPYKTPVNQEHYAKQLAILVDGNIVSVKYCHKTNVFQTASKEKISVEDYDTYYVVENKLNKKFVSEEQMEALLEVIKTKKFDISKAIGNPVGMTKIEALATLEMLEQRIYNSKLSKYPTSVYNYVQDALLEISPKKILSNKEKMAKWERMGKSAVFMASNLKLASLSVADKKRLISIFEAQSGTLVDSELVAVYKVILSVTKPKKLS